MREHQASWTVIGFIAIIGIFPLLSMVLSSFKIADGYSLYEYKELLYNTALWHSFSNSFFLALSVALSSTFVGTLFGLFLVKTKLYFRYIWFAILLIPILIPPYIVAYSWYLLIGRESILAELFFGFWGSFFVLFCIYLPIPLLIISFAITQINPKLEEVGTLFCSWKYVLLKITLPLIKPAIIFSFLLVFIFAISEISVVNFLGYDTFIQKIFIEFSAFYNFKNAIILSMPLTIIVLIFIFIEHIVIQKSHIKFSTQRKIILMDMEPSFLPLLIISIFVFITIVLPLIGLFKSINLQIFLLTLTQTASIIFNSISYAIISGIFLMTFGFFSALIITYKIVKGWQFLNISLLILFVTPSTILGIAFILFWNHSFTNFIYATPFIILLAYLVKYLLLSTKIIEIKLKQIPYNLIDVAKLSGASWYQLIWYILLPLTKDSLVIAWFSGFIFSLRESTITMLVAPVGFTTLPIYTLTTMANGKESTIASLSLIMIFIVIIPFIWLVFILKRRGIING